MNPNEPVFPNPELRNANGDVYQYPSFGISIRQYYAGLAMQGICANPAFETLSFEGCADYAVQQADALIAKLNEIKT